MASDTTSSLQHHVGDRVRVERNGGQHTPGRISSIHHVRGGIEYVVHADAADGGIGSVLNVWTSSGHTSLLVPADRGGSR